MLIAHFDANALLWDKLLKDISNKQKTKKAISGMINGDRPMRFPRARYIHFLTCTGMSLRKRFFCMMSGAVLCIFRIRCQIFDSFNFFSSNATMVHISLQKARFSCLLFVSVGGFVPVFRSHFGEGLLNKTLWISISRRYESLCSF